MTTGKLLPTMLSLLAWFQPDRAGSSAQISRRNAGTSVNRCRDPNPRPLRPELPAHRSVPVVGEVRRPVGVTSGRCRPVWLQYFACCTTVGRSWLWAALAARTRPCLDHPVRRRLPTGERAGAGAATLVRTVTAVTNAGGPGVGLLGLPGRQRSGWSRHLHLHHNGPGGTDETPTILDVRAPPEAPH